MRSLWRRLALAAVLALAAPGAQAQPVGIVLLHGKWGTPSGPIQPLEMALRSAGMVVISREQAWSQTRAYDRTLDEVMLDIDREVAELKAAGVRRVVVGGQSFGANMALAYGARHPELDGVMVLAPGHTPERPARDARMAESLARAHALLAAGKNEQYANFEDINQGRTRQISAKPAVYVSYFDPASDAVMPRNAARLSAHTALLWIVGSHDQMFASGTAYAFDRAPRNPYSAYHTVEGDHFGTPSAARQIAVDWLKGLP
jgi:dienelactone hydrolase